jgi:hypothetical protein
MTDSKTKKTIAALKAFQGSREEAIRMQAREELARGLAMLEAIRPADIPLTDQVLAEMLAENDRDYYGSGFVGYLVAEIKRLRLLARPA